MGESRNRWPAGPGSVTARGLRSSIRVPAPDLIFRTTTTAMLQTRTRFLMGAALLAATAFPLATVVARPSSPAAVTLASGAHGTLHGPSFSSIGKVLGRLNGAHGTIYKCDGTLEPNHDGIGPWTGYSPTGTIEGTLVPLTGSALNGLRFWGSYSIDTDGNGSFHASITGPNLSAMGPRVLMGSFSGRFTDGLEIDPQTLFPIPGDFHGVWNLN